MKIQSIWHVYATNHCTPKNTIRAYTEPHGNEIITPGTSTVAKFVTGHLKLCENFSTSRTERQVNAFIMSCLVTRPSPCHGVCTSLKARRELRHGMLACLWGRAVMPEPLDSLAIRLQIYTIFIYTILFA